MYFKPCFVVVGPNYSFGYQGSGTPDMLKKAGRISGFEVYVHEAVYIDNILVSSTTIRNLIAEGDVRKAASLLGRPYNVTGKVIEGDKRGRVLGFPTANLEIPMGLVSVGDGVYAVYVFIEGVNTMVSPM
jgi:riboflavin kinase/FMN adenylyltransferase